MVVHSKVGEEEAKDEESGCAHVCWQDGMDEISVDADTFVWEVNGEDIKHYTIGPQDFGLSRVPLEGMKAIDWVLNLLLYFRTLFRLC